MCEECIETKVCKICGVEKPVGEFESSGKKGDRQLYKTKCRLCGFKERRNIIYNEIFNENIVDIIIESILYEKISYLDDLVSILNISLEEIILFVKLLKISRKPIRIKCNCLTCNKEFGVTIFAIENGQGKHCSKECFDIDQSMEVLMECKWCGKEFNKTPRNGQENYFCCHECSTKYHAQERTKPLVIVNCAYCGEEFERKGQNKKKIYCSEECRSKGFNLKTSGENNYKYVEKLTIKCDWCGEEITRTENRYNKSTNHFCSDECRNEYHAKIFSQTDEWKEFMRIEAVNRLSNGVFTHTDTKPQLIVNELLQELEVENENEYNCKYYAVDNYLNKSNLMIEVMGTFWHTDHRVFDKINYLSQATGISKDKAKKTYIKKYHYVDILYLWEYDINNNRELCKKLILSYINNNGMLDNYHSFNYNLSKNGLLTINKSIDVPYMDYDIEDLNYITDLSVREARSQYQPDKHITFNCDECGKPSSSLLVSYNNAEHHFCSNICNVSYYAKRRQKSKQLCKVCENNIPYKNGLCKVCTYKSTHDMHYSDKWTEEISNVILNNILYKRIGYLNELEDMLNIPLKDICEYIKSIGYITTLRVKRICLQCGEEFTLPMNRIISEKDKYCSKECSSLGQRKRVILNCECCGKEIEKKQSQIEQSNNHFCSNECADKWRKDNYVSTKVTKICTICGIEYSVIPSQAEKSVACSRECQSKWQSIYLVCKNANRYNGNK